MTVKRNKKSKLLFTAIFLFMIITVISTSCVCPLFSYIERITGFEIKIGKEIDQSLVNEDLIYPGSMVLVQVEGNMNEIMDLIDKYGASLSEKDFSILENLPGDIKNEEFTTTIYSTPDNKTQVLDFYGTLHSKGWLILEIQDIAEGGNDGQGTILLASKGTDEQAFVLAETRNNTFIIFLDIDLEALLEMQK
ncbi:MAG: hypothetical protein PHQ09_05645 [Actinomycetota bacterium]|nr:hypothetical protein [Actinomycetota bacterium]